MQIFLCRHLFPLCITSKGEQGLAAGKPKLCSQSGIATRLKKLVPQQAVRIMKLTAIILLTACLQVSAKGYSQKITLSVKDAPLEQVFASIEKQSDYSFNYYHELIKQARPVTIRVKDATLEEVLAICFRGQPFAYTIINRLIIIKEKQQVIAGLQQQAIPTDPIEVRGVITDENGAPAQGVNVVVKGTSKGTTTNLKGEFVLSGVDENAVLLISSVGYNKQEILVKNKDFITAQLRVAVGNLDELQVIAYGTTSKRFSTGNISTVKAADIEKQPVTNPLLALQGRVTGIQITQLTGLNGGGVTVRIQGRNSIHAGLNPLIVVDGVPFPSELFSNGQETIVQGGSPLNYINPNDIESIDILKDADATSIYGSRAANGAILITTKKGKAGKTKLSINLQQGWSKVTRFADMLNTRQYLDMRYEAFKNDGIDITSLTPNPFNYDLTLWDTTRYTNWQKELIGGTAQYTNIHTSISGGTSSIQYLLGATFNRQTTVLPGKFDDKKASLHFNINSISANQRLTVQLTGSYMYDDNHLPGIDLTTRAVFLEPNAPHLYNTNETLNWAPNASGNSTWLNPLAFIENSDFTNETKNLVTQMTINYKLLSGLTVESSMGFTNTFTNLYIPKRLEYFRPERRATSIRAASFGIRTMSNWIIEPQIRYNRNLGDGKIDGVLGASLQKNSAHNLQVTGQGFTNDQLMRSVFAAPTRNVDADASFQYKYYAVFGRLNYNWKEKYIINFTARRDGSSRFGSKSKFNSFWSIGTGWIFSQEKWMKENCGFMSFGKLRASYGITGNDQIPDYGYVSTYSVVNPSIAYQGASGLQVMSIPNPHMQWEETKKWQGGMDIGFLKDRIILGLTYAQNQSSNQLISYVLPNVTGYSGISKNFPATIRNTSWEFTLHAVNIKGKELTWTSDINLTIPRNKLISFPNIERTSYASGDEGVIVGQPLGILKVYHSAGVDPATGKYMSYDKNGTQVLYPDYITDRTVYLTAMTKFYGGLVNSLNYKGWQLDVLFQFVKQLSKNDFYYGNPDFYPGSFVSLSNGSNQPVSILDRWRKAGDQVTIQSYSTERDTPRYPLFSDVVYNNDASFIRLKNISLSWQLPSIWMKKYNIQNCAVYFRGENLATITKFVGMDPESQSISALPPLQTWTMGIKLEL